MYKEFLRNPIYLKPKSGSYNYKKYFDDRAIEVRLPRHFSDDNKNFPDLTFVNFASTYPTSLHVPSDVWCIPVLTKEKCYEETAKYWVIKPLSFHQSDLEIAKQLLYYHLVPILNQCSTYTTSEIIDRMDVSTSPGYPYNRKYIEKGDAIADPGFYERHVRFEKSLLTSNPIPDVNMSTLKWELRKKGKNPRTFMTGGIHSQIELARLFKQQCDMMVLRHRDLWFGVGLSPFHRSWHDFAVRLVNKGGKKAVFIAADVSGWDRDVPPVLFEAVREVMVSILPREVRTEENVLKSKMLIRQVIHSPVLLPDGETVLKVKGMPSGSYITLWWNCLMHFLVTVCALLRMIRVVEPNHGCSPAELYEVIFQSCLWGIVGDDEIASVNRDLFPWWNFDIYQSTFEQFGFTMKVIERTLDLSEISGFLSCRFVQRYGLWLALPDRVKVLCQVAYAGRDPNPKMTWLRVNAIRMNAYPDPELYALLTDYVDFLRGIYAERLLVDDVSFTTPRQLLSSYLTTSQIKELHTCARAKYALL